MPKLGKFAVVVFAICAFAAWMVFFRTTQEDHDLESAERRHTLEALREFQRNYPGGKREDDAKRAVGRLVLDGMDKIVATAPDPNRAELESVTALFKVLAKRGDPVVALEVSAADVTALAAADANTNTNTEAGANVAPMAPSFARAANSYRYDVADAFEVVLAEAAGDKLVRVDRWEDVDKAGRPVITVSFTVRPSDKVFGLPNQQRAFVGIELDVRMTMTLPRRAEPFVFEATVRPAPDFQFSSDMISGAISINNPKSTAQDGDVYSGMTQSAFEEFVRAWLEHATGT